MGKAIKCRVIIHGSFKQHDGGHYDSITQAKDMLIYEDRPYTIIRLKS